MTYPASGPLDRRAFTRRAALLIGLGITGPLLAACSTEMPSSPAATPPPPTAGSQSAGQAASQPAPTPTTAAQPAQSAQTANPTVAPATNPATGGAGDTVVWFVRTSPLENKFEDWAMAEYKKEQAKVSVKQIVVPGADFNAKLFALQAAGSTPNIFGFAAFATYWARDLAYPIDDYLKVDSNLEQQHFPGLFNTFHWWGKHWGLPMAPRFGNMTFYNRDLFDAAGVPYPKVDFSLKEWNANVMLEKAQKLTKNFGKPDVTFGINLDPWAPHGLAYLWGGDAYRKEMYEQGIDDRTTVDSEASQQAHQFKYDLIHKYKVHPSTADMKGVSILGDPFKTGRVAMVVAGGWDWSSFSDIKAFKWGAAPVPGMKSVKNSENLNIWMLGNAKTGRDASWEFMKFLTSQNGERNWVQITGAQPSRPDVLDDWIKLHSQHMAAEDIKTLVTENIKNTVESMDHMVVDFSRFDDSYNQQVSALWDGKVEVAQFFQTLSTSWNGVAKELYDHYKDTLLKR